jgi:16S rRNA processing protein RimM
MVTRDRHLRVLHSNPHQDRWVVAFEGIEDRSTAESLRGLVLLAAPLEDPEAFWVHHLIGSRLLDQSGQDRGMVVSVQANPASDLLVLEDGGLVPLRFVTGRGDGAVTAELPEGLLD